MKNLFHFTKDKAEILDMLLMFSQYKDKVIFTNGCFDLLHSGHVYLLNESKKLGDILIVGMNSDKSVKLLKGENRPIVCEEDRAYVLLNLEVVDYVIIFDEYSVLNLINFIKPNIITKSSEYSIKDLEDVGGKLMHDLGREVVLIPHREGLSTTELVNKIKNL